jgi:hypothetical protein
VPLNPYCVLVPETRGGRCGAGTSVCGLCAWVWLRLEQLGLVRATAGAVLVWRRVVLCALRGEPGEGLCRSERKLRLVVVCGGALSRRAVVAGQGVRRVAEQRGMGAVGLERCNCEVVGGRRGVGQAERVLRAGGTRRKRQNLSIAR